MANIDKIKRIETMSQLFLSGNTMQEIGDRYGISRERVSKILRNTGVAIKNGGAALRKIKKDKEKFEIKNNRWIPYYKCTYSQLDGAKKELAKEGCHFRKFAVQKCSARRRGISFDMSFPEWVDTWIKSGKARDMGAGHGKYCMSRFGDVGSYSSGNVEIIPSVQNNIDAWKYKKWDTGQKSYLNLYCHRGHYRTSKSLNVRGVCKICRAIKEREKYWADKNKH
jgi:predicted DNA-binding protein YlxM (UPF0122 family)